MKYLVLAVYVLSFVVVHTRGRVRLGFFRQLSDHSTVLAPLNTLIYALSGVPPRPYLDRASFPELDVLDRHWEQIRDEAERLYGMGRIRASDRYDDAGFNSFFKTGWKRFYLKWYGINHPSAQRLCPRTVELLNGIGSVKAAMFAELPPGSRLVLHRDPYAGSLRYHLGLSTPNDPACHITVDGEPYHWRDGESVVFDETYLHFAENRTDRTRIILFCDVERPLRARWAQAFNRWFARHVMSAASSPNETGDTTGGINRAFRYLYQVRLVGKRLKAWNRSVYYLVKWALFGGIFALIFLA